MHRIFEHLSSKDARKGRRGCAIAGRSRNASAPAPFQWKDFRRAVGGKCGRRRPADERRKLRKSNVRRMVEFREMIPSSRRQPRLNGRGSMHMDKLGRTGSRQHLGPGKTSFQSCSPGPRTPISSRPHSPPSRRAPRRREAGRPERGVAASCARPLIRDVTCAIVDREDPALVRRNGFIAVRFSWSGYLPSDHAHFITSLEQVWKHLIYLSSGSTLSVDIKHYDDCCLFPERVTERGRFSWRLS